MLSSPFLGSRELAILRGTMKNGVRSGFQTMASPELTSRHHSRPFPSRYATAKNPVLRNSSNHPDPALALQVHLNGSCCTTSSSAEDQDLSSHLPDPP
ncbi:hypothetical protein AVEN_125605-1 [Araneus ventricosus]|uniref:Uncharacterized protein n=1 Tax=Araneus ventricosus TaxID=182803 RepID=A0A4Y2R0V4_ARAVE|nr:hypothetical protein AVEN_125605-1 [Araneus ventricosus]